MKSSPRNLIRTSRISLTSFFKKELESKFQSNQKPDAQNVKNLEPSQHLWEITQKKNKQTNKQTKKKHF